MPVENKETVQVQLGGTGGQGLILAGIVLADAAVRDGRQVVQTQAYGPEARGGSSVAEVIISKDPIAYPHVEKADILVALSQEACNTYLPKVREGALVIVDSLLVESVPETGSPVLRLPITETARKGLGKEMVANIVSLGALNAAAGLVSWPALEEAVRERVPPAMYDLNRQAIEAGKALAPKKYNGGTQNEKPA